MKMDPILKGENSLFEESANYIDSAIVVLERKRQSAIAAARMVIMRAKVSDERFSVATIRVDSDTWAAFVKAFE